MPLRARAEHARIGEGRRSRTQPLGDEIEVGEVVEQPAIADHATLPERTIARLGVLLDGGSCEVATIDAPVLYTLLARQRDREGPGEGRGEAPGVTPGAFCY